MDAKTVTNYMGAPNYIVSPLTQLRMLITSWFLGEPTYYRPCVKSTKNKISLQKVHHPDMKVHYMVESFYGHTTDEVFRTTVDAALSDDFESTLDLAVKARTEYNMRSGPVALVVFAAVHPQRAAFNESHPGVFRAKARSIIRIPTDAQGIMNVWNTLSVETGKDTKRKMPTILKRILADHLENLSNYQMKKYLNKCNLIDIIRISHPRSNKNPAIEEVIKTGNINVSDTEGAWETLRSSGEGWKGIIDTLGRLPHMALLRNLRGIAEETEHSKYISNTIVPMLVSGVKGGKQFPFRYMSAYEEVSHKGLKYGLKQCIETAMENYPVLKGRTLCLSDNSGSAWGSFQSTYGKQTVAKIANLSSVMTAKNCTGEGVVGVFGDRLTLIPVNDKSVLDQVEHVHAVGNTVGKATENGIWLFFSSAFNEARAKQCDRTELDHYFDNMFFYSDMQCGHGGLFGINPKEYYEFSIDNRYINVLKLVERYRELINPKVNVYMVQVGGYNNTLIPEMAYRCHILSGWTGNEVVFANEMNRIMDDYDALCK